MYENFGRHKRSAHVLTLLFGLYPHLRSILRVTTRHLMAAPMHALSVLSTYARCLTELLNDSSRSSEQRFRRHAYTSRIERHQHEDTLIPSLKREALYTVRPVYYSTNCSLSLHREGSQTGLFIHFSSETDADPTDAV